MSKKKSEKSSMPMVNKGACLVLVGLLAVLGLVGLSFAHHLRNVVSVSRGIAAGKSI